MNRSTGIGWSWRRDPAQAIAELRLALEARGGQLSAAAEDLGITRRHLYRLVQRANLWAEVDQMRARAKQVPDDVARARAMLAAAEGG